MGTKFSLGLLEWNCKFTGSISTSSRGPDFHIEMYIQCNTFYVTLRRKLFDENHFYGTLAWTVQIKRCSIDRLNGFQAAVSPTYLDGPKNFAPKFPKGTGIKQKMVLKFGRRRAEKTAQCTMPVIIPPSTEFNFWLWVHFSEIIYI